MTIDARVIRRGSAPLLTTLLICTGSSAAGNIFEAKYANQADVKVYFVKYQNQAKWRKSSRFRGLFK